MSMNQMFGDWLTISGRRGTEKECFMQRAHRSKRRGGGGSVGEFEMSSAEVVMVGKEWRVLDKL